MPPPLLIRVDEPGQEREARDLGPDRAGHPIERVGVEQDRGVVIGEAKTPGVTVPPIPRGLENLRCRLLL